MSTELGGYLAELYSKEALYYFQAALGFMNRVSRKYDDERKAFKRGNKINIPITADIPTQAFGTGTVADVEAGEREITLDQCQEYKFGINSKDLTFAGDQPIINDHVKKGAYKLANDVNTSLTALYTKVPYSYDIDKASVTSADINNAMKVLHDNAGVASWDMQDIFWGMDTFINAEFNNLNIFHDASIEGAATRSLREGVLAPRFGINFFVDQTLQSHTSGTVVSAGTDNAGTVTGATAKGATSLVVGALDGVETILIGDSFVIAGSAQRYSVQGNVTLAAGAGTVTFFPELDQALSGSEVITFEDGTATGNNAEAYESNVLFHRDFAALVFAPLSDFGDGSGVSMSVATDEQTGMSMRARVAWADGSSTPVVTLDVLWGAQVLDPNLALIPRYAS